MNEIYKMTDYSIFSNQLGKNIKSIYKIINDKYRKDPDLDAMNSETYYKQGSISYYQTIHPNLMIIQMYYGAPHYLQTFWGRINLTGSTYGTPAAQNKMISELKDELGLHLIEEGYQTKNGYFGEWYQVTCINGKKLDYEKLKSRKGCYKTKEFIDMYSYEECNQYFDKYCKDLY